MCLTSLNRSCPPLPLLPPVFEEPEDPSARSFFSEIISSVSDVKFSHSGRYLLTRDYLTAKVWDLNMESKPLETYQVRERPHPLTLHCLSLYFKDFQLPWVSIKSHCAVVFYS